MCHGKWRRFDERTEERRGERLWDLFYRETEGAPPPVADERSEPEREREETLTAAGQRAHDRH
jgi:hypothetical protein